MRQLKITQQVTSRDTPSLDKFLQEIGKIDLITAEQEVELAQRIKAGDEEALDKMVSANLRFVVSVAKQYQNQGLTLSDLINEGNVGLIKAAKRFDETRGFKFISYAVWWIRQSILQALADQSRIVRLPLNKIGAINKVNKAHAKLEQEYQRAPTVEELATDLEVGRHEVMDSMQNSARHVSMDAPLIEGENNSLYDVIGTGDTPTPDRDLMRVSLQMEVSKHLKVLSHRESEVLKCFYGLNNQACMTLEEIGQRFNLTRERVRQIREKAIKKLRVATKDSTTLKSYLG